ncbi:MAG: hypothetical protein JRH17_18325 [Deltaproteobacteria bacterium]|nr:hypothetical protein [Deltaproteobacteria bacterium]
MEEREEQMVDEEQNEKVDGEVNRLLMFGLIAALVITVPALVVMWVAM